MDNQDITDPNMPIEPVKKAFPRKILFIVLGVVVLAELVWAGVNLMKPVPVTAPTASVPLPIEVPEKETKITLSATSSAYLVGENIDVAIDMSSSKKTNGSDLIINFDPKKLTIQNPASPVVKGSIYSSYPVSKVDTKLGKITISGISEGAPVMADGLFGVISFKAKAIGITQVSIEFTPGSTTDTNVIDSVTGLDVLQKVQNLELTIQ